ncbi:MAG: hypothetical protein ACPKPY_01045 [Nitrososphaeraceae archaeon]
MFNSIKIQLGREGEIVEPDNIISREGIVVVLDALGMKRALLEYSENDIFDRWKKTIEDFQYEIMHRHNNQFFRVFSDTIIITCYNNGQDPKNLIDSLGTILINNIINGIKNKIFFRGTLTYGTYSESARLVLGDAINRSAACHEKTNWVGISLFPHTNYYENNMNTNSFVRYNIPYKNEFHYLKNGFALNWIKNTKSKECYKILYDKYNQYKETNYSQYYENTINFYDTIYANLLS